MCKKLTTSADAATFSTRIRSNSVHTAHSVVIKVLAFSPLLIESGSGQLIRGRVFSPHQPPSPKTTLSMEGGSHPARRREPWWPRSQTELNQMLKGYLTADVTTNHADVLLLSCCFISGMVDSTIYHAYGTFVSMQTGLFGAFPPHLLLQWLFPEVLTTKQAILYFWASVAPGRTTLRIRMDGSNP